MHYAHYGHEVFVIGLGHRGKSIKKYYMLDYCSLNRDLSVSLKTGKVRMNGGAIPDWMLELVDTGIKTEMGGRIRRLAPYLGSETFMFAWGDGVADIYLRDLLALHRSHGKLATLIAVRPTARFGYLELEDDRIVEVLSKPQANEGWINGAFLSWSPRCWTTAMTPLSKGNRWNGWLPPANSWPIATSLSGSAWIRCVRNGIRRVHVKAGRLPGRPGPMPSCRMPR
jgi:NDP-sugar pyrophosphorylase family protein